MINEKNVWFFLVDKSENQFFDIFDRNIIIAPIKTPILDLMSWTWRLKGTTSSSAPSRQSRRAERPGTEHLYTLSPIVLGYFQTCIGEGGGGCWFDQPSFLTRILLNYKESQNIFNLFANSTGCPKRKSGKIKLFLFLVFSFSFDYDYFNLWAPNYMLIMLLEIIRRICCMIGDTVLFNVSAN